MKKHRDDGASMVMVLLVVVLIALVSTAFLTKSGTELRASSALQTKVRLQYGADAGLEKGIAALSGELAATTRTHCLTPFDGPQPLSTFTWGTSKYPVTVTCEDLQGYAADDTSGQLFGAAIVTTGGDGSLQSQSAGSTSLDVAGSIYSSGIETSTGASADLKKDINVTKGDYVQFGCTGSPNVTAIKVPLSPSPYAQRCTGLGPSFVAAAVTLPTIPSGFVPPVDIGSGPATCRVFFPGKYTSAPVFPGTIDLYYFASGNYYFDGNFNIDVGKHIVVAGAPTFGDVDNVSGTKTYKACSNDAAAKLVAGTAAGMITGTGAAFFMGGKTSLTVAQGVLSMYSRPLTAGIDIPLNIYAVRGGDTGWDPWTGGSTNIISGTDANSNMLFNGQINAYDAPVDLFASNPTVTGARAGIIAKTLKLQASAKGTNLDISGYGTSPKFGSRIVRLSVHAAGLAGDAGASDGVAVVVFPNDLSAPTVKSWRFS